MTRTPHPNDYNRNFLKIYSEKFRLQLEIVLKLIYDIPFKINWTITKSHSILDRKSLQKMNRTKKHFTKKLNSRSIIYQKSLKNLFYPKKLSLQLGFKKTLEDREVGNHFWRIGLLEGDSENNGGNFPIGPKFKTHKKFVGTF